MRMCVGFVSTTLLLLVAGCGGGSSGEPDSSNSGDFELSDSITNPVTNPIDPGVDIDDPPANTPNTDPVDPGVDIDDPPANTPNTDPVDPGVDIDDPPANTPNTDSVDPGVGIDGGGEVIGPDDCDQFSLTADWADNCPIGLNTQYADTTYTLAVERMLWVLGYMPPHPLAPGQLPINGFDGYFDLDLQQAIIDYQTQQGIIADSVVGSDTWIALQSELVPAGYSLNLEGFDSYIPYEFSRADLPWPGLFIQNTLAPFDWYMGEQYLNGDFRSYITFGINQFAGFTP